MLFPTLELKLDGGFLAFTRLEKDTGGDVCTLSRGDNAPKTEEKGVRDRMCPPCNRKSVAPGCVMQ